MKTAEHWAVTFTDETTQYEMATLFRDIQLDSFKAGAEWAAKIAQQVATVADKRGQSEKADCYMHASLEILSASSNLKELPK